MEELRKEAVSKFKTLKEEYMMGDPISDAEEHFCRAVLHLLTEVIERVYIKGQEDVARKETEKP